MGQDPNNIKRHDNIGKNVTITRRTKSQQECKNAQAICISGQVSLSYKIVSRDTNTILIIDSTIYCTLNDIKKFQVTQNIHPKLNIKK